MMDNKTAVLYEMINNLYLSVSQLAETVPMGGNYYLEKVSEYLAEHTLNQHRNFFTPASDKTIDICQSWINMLDNIDYINRSDYLFTQEGEKLKISVNKKNCTYRDFCSKALQEKLPHTCPRMVSCKWIASRETREPYQLQLLDTTDDIWCTGIIYPSEDIEEILARDGNIINIAGDRAIVLSTNAYGILLKTIYNWMPELLGQVLYESAHYSALLDYDKVSKYYGNSRDVIEHLLNTVNLLGNIRYEIVKYDEINKEAEIRGYNSYLAEIFKNNNLFKSPKASCHSARGRLAAYFSKAWQTEIVCEELRCEALGDDYCEFILLPKDN